jgi:hypothetical protein
MRLLWIPVFPHTETGLRAFCALYPISRTAPDGQALIFFNLHRIGRQIFQTPQLLTPSFKCGGQL